MSCSELFKRIFQGCCLLFNYQGSFCFSTARLVYHIFFSLSRTFSFYFYVFFCLNDSLLTLTHIFLFVNNYLNYFFQTSNGERGIWTLAPVTRPTPLAGAPLRPLEYFSIDRIFILFSFFLRFFGSALIIIHISRHHVNVFFTFFLFFYSNQYLVF